LRGELPDVGKGEGDGNSDDDEADEDGDEGSACKPSLE
jgi:hypothetical protein